jgi:hypothetical protein
MYQGGSSLKIGNQGFDYLDKHHPPPKKNNIKTTLLQSRMDNAKNVQVANTTPRRSLLRDPFMCRSMIGDAFYMLSHSTSHAENFM